MPDTIYCDLQTLEEQFSALISKEIPLPKAERITFLEVAQMPHYEVVISRIYKFYLSDHADHGFRDLFLSSFIQLINEAWKKKKETSVPFFASIPREWSVETEVVTQKDNRIDIWIDWQEEENRKTIVVENKIFHFLRNDLDDYFNTPEGNPKDKIGVLLTLGPQDPGKDFFVNITHDEWLTRVRQNWGNYVLDADDRHLFFLKDFMLNMTKLVKDLNNMHDFIQYYTQNRMQIETMVSARNQFATQLLDAYTKAGLSLEWGILHKKADRYRSLKIDPKFDFKLTFIFDDGKAWEYPCYICLEVYGNLLPLKNVLRDNREFLSKHGLNKHTHEGAGYAYIADKGYNLSDLNNRDLVTYFADTLEKVWKPACKDFIEILKELKTGS